ncbi:hypothetical protein PVBG_05748 [Plasmodium vivax Brazil I]|uniref:VIR protein n=1 Tax=Plasmodium vivax (strain Brazil I) TaxID=1033975 RepID=A0A0J9SN01_PLAV1|nr:hypothetical protein PVBG_05748 [Plasmodium vivax Brazil I]
MMKTDVTKLEKESKELGLNKAYDALFTSDGISKIDTECKVFESGTQKNDGAKKLCSKLLYLLENIAKNPTAADNVKRCSYLRYWFYDQIRGIHNDHSKKISEITFIKELTDIRKKVYNKELKYTCEILYDKDVNLDEWKKRILSYIYFKNYDDIKKISISTKKTECNKHLAYVESFIPLYKEYYEKHCRSGGFLFFSPVGTDYFPCSSLYDPNKLLAALKLCKPPEPPKIRTSASSALVSGGIPGQGSHVALPTTLQIRNDAGQGAMAAIPSTLESASDKTDSNFIRDIIMGVAVIGTIFFLFFYNMEKESKELGLNKAYDALFTSDGISKIDTECKVFESGSKKHDGAKKLCSKLLYILENIAKNPKTTDNVKRCSYLRYWFYDQIRGIHNDHSKKIGEISFIKELTDIRKKVYKNELKYTCEILFENNVNLDEWKKRILSYIYFKNHDDIKKISISKNRIECDKRLKYVESFMPLYTEYYEKHCRNSGFFLFSPGGTDYFRCLSSYNPKDLLAALKKCEPPEPPKSRISAGSASVSGRAGGSAPIRNDAGHGATAAVPNTLESTSDKMDSNFIRDIIMGVAVIGTIFFLFFYNMSSGLKFSSPIKKRNKKKMKHNYYEEYEKEFEKYDSEDMSLDSEEDRYHLNYQPEGDYDY